MKSLKRSLVSSTLLALFAAAPALLQADEAAVKAKLEQKWPQLKIDQLTATPYPGLYEIFASGILLYTDEQAAYLLQGTLFDTQTRRNISNERLAQLTAITFEQLPLDLAIKIVKGDGKRRLAVFEDPDCPFCRELEKTLDKIDNVTIYVFLYPIEKLHRGSTQKSRQVWCAKDRVAAWRDAVHNGTVAPETEKCEAPLDKIADFGRRLRISGTPTLFFGDGKRVSGAIPGAQIEQLLGASEKSGEPPAAPAM